jgi:hypothetical protein
MCDNISAEQRTMTTGPFIKGTENGKVRMYNVFHVGCSQERADG